MLGLFKVLISIQVQMVLSVLKMEGQRNTTGFCGHCSLTDYFFSLSPLAVVLNMFCIYFHVLSFFYSVHEHRNHGLRCLINRPAASDKVGWPGLPSSIRHLICCHFCSYQYKEGMFVSSEFSRNQTHLHLDISIKCGLRCIGADWKTGLVNILLYFKFLWYLTL